MGRDNYPLNDNILQYTLMKNKGIVIQRPNFVIQSPSRNIIKKSIHSYFGIPYLFKHLCTIFVLVLE